jgi:hypothetical protein
MSFARIDCVLWVTRKRKVAGQFGLAKRQVLQKAIDFVNFKLTHYHTGA